MGMTSKNPLSKPAMRGFNKQGPTRNNGAAGRAPFHEADPKRRLGNFGGTGEHPRVGGRSSGIVGQTTKKRSTDNKKGSRAAAGARLSRARRPS